MTNWNEIITEVGKDNLASFVAGDLSGSHLYDLAKGTKVSGQVRKLVRQGGIAHARKIAREALRRRK